MMQAKEKAIELVDKYRLILMSEDTECGNEILCTLIAKKCAILAADELRKEQITWQRFLIWAEVITEIDKL